MHAIVNFQNELYGVQSSFNITWFLLQISDQYIEFAKFEYHIIYIDHFYDVDQNFQTNFTEYIHLVVTSNSLE